MKDDMKQKLEEATVEFNRQIKKLFEGLAGNVSESAQHAAERAEQMGGLGGERGARLKGMALAYKDTAERLNDVAQNVVADAFGPPPWLTWIVEMAEVVDSHVEQAEERSERQTKAMETIAKVANEWGVQKLGMPEYS